MTGGFVSVIMPVLDGERFVAEAVASVRAQGWPELELIAVDDGSTDEIPAILAGLAADPANRMRVVRTGNRGPAAARNYAIGLARGSFIAFIDADDLWPDGKLEAQMRRFAERPEINVVYGLVEIRDCEGHEGASAWMNHDNRPAVMANLGSAVCRARAFAQVGMLDEGLRQFEDVDWLLRAIEAGLRLTVIRQVTLLYRHHDRNVTRDAASLRRGMTHALQRSLARRRADGTTARDTRQLADFLEPVGLAP